MKRLLPSRKRTSKAGESSEAILSGKNLNKRAKTGDENVLVATNLPVHQARPGLGVRVIYEPPEPSNAIVDIVFIHGLTGASDSTWLHHKAQTLWPASLLGSDIPDSRIITFGYDANVVNFWTPASQNGVEDHALSLLGGLTRLKEQSDSEERKIIFVAHSLGGLVTQECLWSSRNNPEPHLQRVSSCTIGLLFLGTPNHGADLAEWATLGTTIASLLRHPNSDIVSVLTPGSKMLSRVQHGFHSFLRLRTEIAIMCFFEELPLRTVGKVVEKESAIIPGFPHEGILANHMNMTKFSDSDDDGYKKISGELRRWVKKLRPGPDTPAPATKTPHFLVPFSIDKKFVNRVDIFKEIDERAEAQSRIAILGNGGVGKSQIAIEYCYRFQDKHPQAHVVWIHASTRQRFEQAYREIARKIQIPGWDNPSINILQVVVEWFDEPENGEWLMVLDNADDLDTFFTNPALDTKELECVKPIVDYLPRDSNGLTLITTRDKRVGCRLRCHRSITVQPMSPGEAKELLQSHLDAQINASDDDLSEVAKSMDYIPMAITQAIAFMNENSTTPAQYLSKLRSDDSELQHLLEDDDVGDLRRDAQSRHSVIRTLKISFDLINKQNKRAAKMLSLIAVLDRQGIAESLLRADGERKVIVTKALGILLAFSLIKPQKDGRTFEMHRLVHLAAQRWLEMKGTTYFWKRQALKAVATEFPYGSYENWTVCESLLPHAQVAIHYRHISEACAKHFVILGINMAWYQFKQGQNDAAYNVILAAMCLGQGILGPDHDKTLRCMEILALILLNTDRFNEAKALQKQVLKTRIKWLGGKHPDTLFAMGNLINLYPETGRAKEAMKLQEELLQTRKEELGVEHMDTMHSVSSLANDYHQSERLEEAKKLYLQVMKTREKVLGSEHPSRSSDMHNLACLYHKQGHHGEAITMMEDALKAKTKVLGAQHPTTLFSADRLQIWKERSDDRG